MSHSWDSANGDIKHNEGEELKVLCFLVAVTSNWSKPAIHVDGHDFIITIKIFSVEDWGPREKHHMKWRIITRCDYGPLFLVGNDFFASSCELANGLCHYGCLLEERKGWNRTMRETVHRKKREKDLEQIGKWKSKSSLLGSSRPCWTMYDRSITPAMCLQVFRMWWNPFDGEAFFDVLKLINVGMGIIILSTAGG